MTMPHRKTGIERTAQRASRTGLRIGLAAGLWIAVLGCGAGGRRDAQVEVVTTPPGAVVFCNGVNVGVAPVTITRLPPGTHALTAVLDGHRDAHRAVSVLQGQRTTTELRLEPLTGLIQVAARPEGARVFLGGAYRGQAPLFMPDVPAGEQRITVEAPGYLPKEVVFQVADRTPRRVEVALIPDAGRVQVRSDPPGATVRLNGVVRGETPLDLPDVPSGENLIEIILPGFQPFSERVVLRAQEERELATTLVPLPTRLQVVSIPSGARVYVGNQFRGETPMLLTDLQPGEHRIRSELRGYAPSARTIRLEEDRQAVEEFRLVRNSGTLVLVTEPAEVRVFLDGEEVGRTRATPESDVLSEPFELDLLPPGEYRIQLTRRGYTHRPRTIRIEVNEVTEIHETMTRRFVADTRIRMGEMIREGMLLREYPNGDIELQLETGTIMRIPAEDIASRETIRIRD